MSAECRTIQTIDLLSSVWDIKQDAYCCGPQNVKKAASCVRFDVPNGALNWGPPEKGGPM